jgi:hypothetical protein
VHALLGAGQLPAMISRISLIGTPIALVLVITLNLIE